MPTGATDGSRIRAEASQAEMNVKAYREIADATVRGAQLTPGTRLEFGHAEVADQNVRFVYNKVFDQPRKESPSTVIVVVDRATQTAAILAQE